MPMDCMIVHHTFGLRRPGISIATLQATDGNESPGKQGRVRCFTMPAGSP